MMVDNIQNKSSFREANVDVNRGDMVEMMQKVNVYDFDDTIYRGDSSRDFYFYCLAKHPKIWLLQPMVAFYGILFLLKMMPKTQFKEKVFMFLQWIPDINDTINNFWNMHIKNIKEFYKHTKKDDDIIITASPEFLVKPAMDYLGIPRLLGSKIDKYTGKYDGLNCYGDEKVHRLKESFPNVEVAEFYSDSKSDTPLAELADKAYLVKGNQLLDWD